MRLSELIKNMCEFDMVGFNVNELLGVKGSKGRKKILFLFTHFLYIIRFVLTSWLRIYMGFIWFNWIRMRYNGLNRRKVIFSLSIYHSTRLTDLITNMCEFDVFGLAPALYSAKKKIKSNKLVENWFGNGEVSSMKCSTHFLTSVHR